MDPKEFGEAVKAHRCRKHPTMSQTDAAAAAGVKQSTWARLESGSFKEFQPWMLKAAALVGFDVEPARIGLDVFSAIHPTKPAELTTGSRNFSLYGTNASSDGMLFLSEEPIDYVPMPSFLMNVSGAYAVLVADDTMEPEFRAEDQALVNPHLPPIAGRTCLFRTSESGGTGLIRILLRQSATHWVVQSHNPRAQEKLAKTDWPVCHRIVGRYYR